jgi:predicted RND superfamily exporter protein
VTALCLLPLVGGILVLLALMHPLGLAFNLANIITLPLILGIGVDNGILILERFRGEEEVALFSGNTGRAILMSNLTTIAGFVALGFARHQGIASLGQIMALGVGATMLVSLIALPAVIRVLKQRGAAI